MTSRGTSNIVIEKINLERASDFQDVIIESGKEWYASGMLPKPNLSAEELGYMVRAYLVLWEKDDTYMFYIKDVDLDQIVGIAFLNRMNRIRQFANLGYSVRTSRVKQGIATAAAKLVARYGFEKLGLQRIEVVVNTDNIPSLRVAEKLGAVREGLLRNGLRMHGVPCNAYLYSLIPTDLWITNTAQCVESEMSDSRTLNLFFHRIFKN